MEELILPKVKACF